MKKALILAIFSVVLVSSQAMAEFVKGDASGAVEIGSTQKLTLKLSKDVAVEYLGSTTSGEEGLGYVIGASHSSGTRTFASSSGDAKIWYKDGINTAIPTTVPIETESANFSGWTAL